MKAIKKPTVLPLLIILSLSPLSLHAKNFTTATVIQTAHSYQCLSYSILPNPCIYMYLSCSFFSGCSIKFTARDRIQHKLPDLVVSSFSKSGNNPWWESQQTESKLAVKAMQSAVIKAAFANNTLRGAGHENMGVSLTVNQSKNNLRFHEVNVIGSPASRVIRRTMKYAVPRLMGSPYLCPSSVRPMFPYFMSEVDAIAWRKAELNISPQSFPGRREIGNWPTNTWGSVFPRIGFVIQTEVAKAAAISAQRAIDIVSKHRQMPHLYQAYPMSGISEKTPAWQMISPKKSNRCEAFGSPNLHWAKDKNNEDGQYAWNYWRTYQCCKPGPGILLNP